MLNISGNAVFIITNTTLIKYFHVITVTLPKKSVKLYT